MSESAISDFMSALPERFDAGGSSTLQAEVQFHFTGPDAADWVLEVDGARCRTAPGTASNPAVTLTVDSADFMALLSGEMQPMTAFMRGKLKLQGDVSLAMKLPGMFS